MNEAIPASTIPTPSTSPLTSAAEVVASDLDAIAAQLGDEFERLAGKHLLITGGAGFLGYYLVQGALHANRLRGERPTRVTVVDNYIRGVPAWLEKLTDDPQLELVRHDITRPLPEALAPAEYIVHAASIASPIYYRKYPIETMDANVGGLRHLLERAVEQQGGDTPVEGFLYFSTSEIYGDPTPENIPTPETYRGNVSCTGPRACYDESKRFGETLSVNFARQHGLPVRIARPFNNYGPGLKISDRRVLPDFARDVLAGRDITLLSDGSPSRTFCYVSDAVVGYYKVLVRGRDGEAYNIGVDGPEITMRELADRVIAQAREMFGYGGKLVRGESSDADYLTDNPNRRCPVIDKARSELDYDPKIGIDEGLRRSLAWYAENREAEDA